MAWSGNHSQRPTKVFTIIHATSAMHHEAALLGSNGVVAWLDRDLTASVQDITAAIVAEIGMLADDVCVVKHFPEALLVRFFHQHHSADATGHRDIPFRDTRLQLCPMAARGSFQAGGPRPPRHNSNMDGLAFQCVARELSYPAGACGGEGGQPFVGRPGLERRVIIHLSIPEDPTQGPTIVSKGYNYQKGVVDGEWQARDPYEHISRPVDHHRRDRKDDPGSGRGRDDQDRRDRDSSRSCEGWGVRIRRSLSRHTTDASRGNHHDEGRDGRREGGGRRRATELATAVASVLGSSARAPPVGRRLAPSSRCHCRALL
ncbi:hypothetical protein ZWY2020_016895 [Hordeum vulgare]|nr:hypothetical protein ZWY2020_016895 [Hordeum vulgare]